MADYLSKLMETAGTFGRGMILEMIPKIAGGYINELFRQEHITVATVTKYIKNNQSLWGEMGPDQHRQIGDLVKRVGNLDFITPEFLIDSIKEDFPGVASLFINWQTAMKWLTEQLEDIKSKIQD